MSEQGLDSMENAVHEFVVAFLRRRMQALQLADLTVSDDLNMIDSGLLDSIGFIELMTAVEDRFELEIDLEERDPASFTTVAGFARIAALSRPETK